MPTTNPVPSTDPTDLLFNAQKLDQVVNGSAKYYTDRLGINRRTMEGVSAAADVVLGGIGYAPPVAYAAGISMTLTTQTVEYSGEIYAPKVASLPFTTSTWATDSAKFRLIQGVAATDLAASGGSSMIGYMPEGTGAVATTVHAKLRESVSVKDFGAVGDGVADDTAAIQAAINYAIYYSSGSLTLTSAGMKVFIPRGIYKITDTIHLGYGVGGYTSLIFEGECQFGTNASTVVSGIVPTFNDRPAINVQGGRFVKLKNFAVTGVNNAWLQSNYDSIADRSTVENWYGPNISAANNTRYAPYCGICVDAYSGPAPATAYPNVNYPSFLGTVSQYNKNYSSFTTLENVTVQGFVVGLMVQPGNVPSASNGDFVTVRDSLISHNIVNYADGHADARNPNIENSRLHFAHTCIDGLTYGTQSGKLAINGVGSSFDNVYRIFNINIGGTLTQGGFNVNLTSCYSEALNSIGNLYASGDVPTGISLVDTKFTFIVKSGEYAPVYTINAPGCDLYMRNVLFNGAYGFHHLNANVTIEGMTVDKLQADVFSTPSGQANKIAKSFTCGVYAPKSYRTRVNIKEFYTFFGYNIPNSRIDSESLPIDLDNVSAAGTGYGFPIPWFINQMAYGTAKYSVSNVAPIVLNRATYNLSSVTQSGIEYTFTCDNAFITDAVGANTDAPFYVGKGDIVTDSNSGLIFAVISVSFSGTGPGTTMTATMRQLNYVRNVSGSTWVAGGSLSANFGTLTFYNARRVYPSPYRVNFTATSGSGAINLKICGDESAINFMALPVAINDYLISSKWAQNSADSVFPKFTKVSAVNVNNGSITLNQNARRSYYGETPLFVKVL